jgi:hypothetical protein
VACHEPIRRDCLDTGEDCAGECEDEAQGCEVVVAIGGDANAEDERDQGEVGGSGIGAAVENFVEQDCE